MLSSHWQRDCLKWRGEILTGLYAHWCSDWDGLPVDETCLEFEACGCFSGLTRWQKFCYRMRSRVHNFIARNFK